MQKSNTRRNSKQTKMRNLPELHFNELTPYHRVPYILEMFAKNYRNLFYNEVVKDTDGSGTSVVTYRFNGGFNGNRERVGKMRAALDINMTKPAREVAYLLSKGRITTEEQHIVSCLHQVCNEMLDVLPAKANKPYSNAFWLKRYKVLLEST